MTDGAVDAQRLEAQSIREIRHQHERACPNFRV